MENYNIPDSSIQASSRHALGTKASLGRLNLQDLPAISGVGGPAWAAGVLNTQQWFKVDFGNWKTVSAIATQGRQNIAQWVTTYRVSYSHDGLLYAAYKENSTSNVKVFWALFFPILF